jgi:hypothetical protein
MVLPAREVPSFELVMTTVFVGAKEHSLNAANFHANFQAVSDDALGVVMNLLPLVVGPF